MSRPAVLVVDRRSRAVETAASIDDRYRTRTASTVDAAVELADACDAVLLDAATRTDSEADVVARLRELSPLPPVALLVRQDPDFPLFRSPFDDYAQRPLSRSDLIDTVERLLARGACDRVLRSSYATARRLARLEANSETDCTEYDDLRGRFDRQRARLGDYLADLEADSYDVATRHLVDSGTESSGSPSATDDGEDPTSASVESDRPGIAADDANDAPRH